MQTVLPLQVIAHPLRKHAKTSKAILNSFALFGGTCHLPSGEALSIPTMSDRNAVELLYVSNPHVLGMTPACLLTSACISSQDGFMDGDNPTSPLTPFAMA